MKYNMNPPGIVELDVERARKQFIAEFQNSSASLRELATQSVYLIDRCRLSQKEVGELVGKTQQWAGLLYKWAKAGFEGDLWGNEKVRGTQGTGENEWYTPAKYIEMARKVLGEIDLDPASNEIAQKVVRAKHWFTAKQDGLKQKWFGRVWLNPPYSQPLIGQFVSKLCEERCSDNVSAAILLTHNYTDGAWFHEGAQIADAVCFTRGRIKFVDPKGNECAPTQGQAFSYFGDDPNKFADVFKDIGIVYVPASGEE